MIRPPWFNVRLTFADGARIDVLAVVDDGRIAIEDLRADPPLPLEAFPLLADVIENPLEAACGVSGRPPEPPAGAVPPGGSLTGRRRARRVVVRGIAGRRLAAGAYRAAQLEGRDPVLAVMAVTGRSRRKSLRLIAGARDEGFLPPRHNRRRTPVGARAPSHRSVTSSASG
ncbi:DUF6214 family protein [Streptomyces sp. SLBN-118]|uniref:DUF6214 family protein n=1 Tax=Streptomyces sp. SLBN-118 TaxID=2768454 RepID=UPI001C931220|nr:DUF6214 family protein [Streptomyces sp. SLBN-118]